MVFSSILFLFIYLPIVLVVYYLIPDRLKNYWLFFVNLIFYGWGEPVYIFLMLFSITINYFNGWLISIFLPSNRKKAKATLIVNIIINLGLLVFFKYYNLLAVTVSILPGVSVQVLNLTLPIGISFYTFQTMSYPIDLYRGDIRVQKNYIVFGTYVALFPQLIAGPIVRYKDISDQLEKRTYSVEQFSDGVIRFTIGLGKKVLLANNIGKLWDYYAAQSSLSFTGAWLGAIAFSLNLYYDFSGYSDMVIGLGKMLGFSFPKNFDFPYISKSVTEFWRRWHISLGTWFRDYLYIPLGGNRKGLPVQLCNILVVWALTGLWHGSNWSFLLWGLYYALFLILEKVFLLKKLSCHSVLAHFYTVVIAVFGWVLFQLESVSRTLHYWSSMLCINANGFISSQDIFQLRSYITVLFFAILFCIPLVPNTIRKFSPKVKTILSPVFIILIFIFSTAYLVDNTYNPFLYFRF